MENRGKMDMNENTSKNEICKIEKCSVCNGWGLINKENKFYKSQEYSYENRYKKDLIWVECPRCIGYGNNKPEARTNEWDKNHLSF